MMMLELPAEPIDQVDWVAAPPKALMPPGASNDAGEVEDTKKVEALPAAVAPEHVGSARGEVSEPVSKRVRRVM